MKIVYILSSAQKLIIMIRLILYYIIFTIHMVFWQGLANAGDKKCVAYEARKPQCSENEICIASICECLPGYKRLSDHCVESIPNRVPTPAPFGPPNDPPDQQDSNVAVAIIIPIFLILIVIGTIVMARKYNLLNWVRNKLNQRQTPYDEVMIGQDDDDPPLAGV